MRARAGVCSFYCHAGCTYETICEVAGIDSREGEQHDAKQFGAAYDYRDEQGTLLYQVLRKEPKGFLQRKPEGNGWTYKLNGVRRVLYRLPDIMQTAAGSQVFVVEGEKDADRLASLGLVATTNAGGAGKWFAEFAEYLRGFHVVVLPDNDEPGEKHAKQVEQFLRGIAASVRVLTLPNLPPKGDVSDWLDAGHTPDELLALAEAAQESATAKAEGVTLRIACMADVATETVRWLWYPYIALGKLTLLEGDPGLGKSWLTCALASAVTRGRGLPGAEPFEPGNVLMLSAEDGLEDTLRPRLDAVRADVSRVYALAEPLTFDTPGLLRLEAAILDYSPVLVIVDPLFAFTGGKVDIHRANECRAISAPLAAIAQRTGCALVAIRHLGKSRGGGHALNAGIGSIDFTAAARSVLLVGKDPDEPMKRAIVQIKNNLAPHGEAVGYTLDAEQFCWTGASDLTAGRILSGAEDEEERGSMAEAVDFLRVALSDGGRDAKAIEAEAKQAGVNPATLRRAKARLGVRSHKVGMPNTRLQKWVWELRATEGVQAAPEGVQENGIEHLRANGADKGAYDNNLSEEAQTPELEHLRRPVEYLRDGDAPDELAVHQRVTELCALPSLSDEDMEAEAVRAEACGEL